MSKLMTKANIAHPDDIYELLINLHEGLSESEISRANAGLILVLVNHIGDEEIIKAAIATVRQQVPQLQSRSSESVGQ